MWLLKYDEILVELLEVVTYGGGVGSNDAADVTTKKGNREMSTQATVTRANLIAALAALPSGRSAWSRAVHTYAVEIVESIDASADLSNETLLRKALLNGAADWHQYSEGGCALIYDADIAERLCSASELKRCKGGEHQPNGWETWIECQARALCQAEALVRRAYRMASAAATEGGAL